MSKKQENTFSRISILGLGFVGLPTAAIFASRGAKVVGVDINHTLVEQINSYEITSREPGLRELLGEVVTNGYLTASTRPSKADVFIICVPTPIINKTKEPDISYVRSAVQSIAQVLQPDNLLILESTCPVGTTEKIQNWIGELRPDLVSKSDKINNLNVSIAYCPERVLPGNAIFEITNNPRVIGGVSKRCTQRAKQFFGKYLSNECWTTNARTAEMTKLTENSFRDVNIAFANEISMLCDDLHIDVKDLIELANLHPRVNILEPGPGVGGHCIAIDPWFLITANPKNTKLITAAREVNLEKSNWVLRKIKEAVIDHLNEYPNKTESNMSIGLYGLTYKKDVDDFRESPSLKICEELCTNFSGTIHAIDPNLKKVPSNLKNKNLKLNNEKYNLDIVVLLVGHTKFLGLRKLFSSKVKIIDTIGMWDSDN